MRVVVGARFVIVVSARVQFGRQYPVDLIQVLAPDEEVYVVVPRYESVMPQGADRRSEMHVEPYPVFIQDGLHILVHPEKGRLDLIHTFVMTDVPNKLFWRPDRLLG